MWKPVWFYRGFEMKVATCVALVVLAIAREDRGRGIEKNQFHWNLAKR